MRALHLGDRRFLTFAILALASVLEVCGCNPFAGGDGTGGTGLAALCWPASLGRCKDCPPNTPAEGSSVGLAQGRKEPQAVDADWSSSEDKLWRQPLRQREGTPFYDPDTLADDGPPRDLPPLRSAVALQTKPGPWTLSESVFFVYRTIVTADGKPHRVPSATAFVLSVPDSAHRRPVRFLVTARHVVDPEWAHCSEKNPQSIDIRLNRRTGGVGYETIPLQGFFAPSDKTSDVAVIRLDQHLIPNLESYKFFDTPFSLLPTDSELRMVHPDQQIMTAGLLTRMSPETSIYPVSHGGALSSNSIEAVTMQCGSAPGSTELHVWFINASVPQGVSGAPVFTSMSRGPTSTSTPVLLGVQAVAWPDRGIAGMTPSTVLSDLIHQALHDTKQPMDFSKGETP